MTHVTYTELRQNLANYLDEACDSRAPIFVTRQRGKGDVVLIAAEEFAGWQETIHLLSSPANAARIVRSIRAADAGETFEHELVPATAPADK